MLLEESNHTPSPRPAWMLFVFKSLLLTALVLASLAQLAVAQDIFGRISGTVTDPTGAVIPNVKVHIVNDETKLTRDVTTDPDGFYVATDLHVGSYSVATESQGFKSTRKSGNVLVAGGRLTVDVRLEVGASSETVEVTAQGETVNTTSGEITRTVDTRQVQSLALNQRNYGQLVSLIPGSALTTFDQTSLTTGMSTTAASVNGLRADGNLFTVDGGFNLDGGSNATQLNNVGIDFIREVAVATSNYSAEYGRSDGASVNVVTRSGGNSFHGGAFEYVRNDIFDAANPASKLNAAPGASSRSIKPALRFNDFGWNFGGPIKKGRLFFFAGEEWKRIRQSANAQNMTVPTSAELSGNFTDVAGLVLKTPPNAPAGCTITGNVMSAQCITPDGQAIANVYKLMESQATAFNNTPTANNATFQPNNPQNWREDIVRVDFNASKNHNLYYRYIHDSLNLIDAFGTFTPGGLPTTPTNRIRPGYSHQAADVWTINSHLVNEAKLNVSWNKQRIPPSGNTWQRSTYGFKTDPPLGLVGSYPDGIPHVTFTGVAGFPTTGPAQFTGPYFSLLAPTVDITPSDNLTWQKGSHTLKFGAMYARNRKDQNSRPDSYNGRITFATSGNPNTTGNPFADALMGNFQTYAQQSADPVGHFRFNQYEAYANDSWKVSRKLSVELGVRYIRTGPTYTQGNNMVNFDPAQYSAAQAPTSIGSNNVPVGGLQDQGFVINGLVRPGSVPSPQLVRVPGGDSSFVTAVPATAPRGFFKPENLFAPRVGFSYAPFNDGKSVIRGGFGIFYDKPEGNIIFGQPGVVPFLKSVTYQNANIANPSAGVGVVPTIFGMSAVDPNFVVARSMQFSLSIQHELPYGVLLDLAYVGNLQRHLVRQPNINVPSFSTALANVGKTTNQERPYFGYTDITQFRSDANANYNALQFYATKRAGDLTVALSYTWSHALGQASGINDNPEPECPFTCQTTSGQIISWRQFYYGPVGFDRRHIFVVSYNYDFPFFRKHGGLAGAVLGGWAISGITRAQSGSPLTVTGTQTIGPSGSGVTAFSRRANIMSGVPIQSGYTCPTGKICWFNPAAFVQEPTTGVGNAPVGGMTGPGYYGWDLSLRKNFKLPREGTSLMFQADAFNAFNHTNWGNPGTGVTGGGFGQIGGSNPPRNVQFGAKFAF
jgi:hypothetical protein